MGLLHGLKGHAPRRQVAAQVLLAPLIVLDHIVIAVNEDHERRMLDPHGQVEIPLVGHMGGSVAEKHFPQAVLPLGQTHVAAVAFLAEVVGLLGACLLYTSDAADE